VEILYPHVDPGDLYNGQTLVPTLDPGIKRRTDQGTLVRIGVKMAQPPGEAKGSGGPSAP
jgi:hypothetical protein